MTYLSRLWENEEILAGRWWDENPAARPEISVSEDYAEWLMLGLGDTLTIDYLGREFEAEITSIRRQTRRIRPVSYLTRFNIIFRPGTLDDLPHPFLGALQGPSASERRGRFQREFVEQFLNVSVIDAFDTIAELRRGVAEASFVVSFIGGFVFLCGTLILIGSISITKFHRLYEAAILRALGARQKLIVWITVIEYGVLGLLAGAIGSASAIALTWAVSTYGMKISWELVPSVNLLGAAATMLVVTTVGVLASWDVLFKKPLGILREQ
jgi:putative ABC transport system permease protein